MSPGRDGRLEHVVRRHQSRAVVSTDEFGLLQSALSEQRLRRLSRCAQEVYVLEGLSASEFVRAMALPYTLHYCRTHCLHRCGCQGVAALALATRIAARGLEAVGASDEARTVEVEEQRPKENPSRLWMARARLMTCRRVTWLRQWRRPGRRVVTSRCRGRPSSRSGTR